MRDLHALVECECFGARGRDVGLVLRRQRAGGLGHVGMLLRMGAPVEKLVAEPPDRRLSRAVLVSALLHVVLAIGLWFVAKPAAPEPELVDIELAPPPPNAEALPEEVAKPPATDPGAGAHDEAAAEDRASHEEEGAPIDAGIAAPVDAAVDAPLDAAKRRRPDAAADAALAAPTDAPIDADLLAGSAGSNTLQGSGENDTNRDTNGDTNRIANGSNQLGGSGQLAGSNQLAGSDRAGSYQLALAAGSGGSGAGSGIGSGAGAGSDHLASSTGSGTGADSGVAAAVAAGSGSGVAGRDNQPAVAGAATTAGTAAHMLAYIPPGHRVTALVRFDRLRGTEWAQPAEQLFHPMPDYRALFGTRDAAIADKLAMLVISP